MYRARQEHVKNEFQIYYLGMCLFEQVVWQPFVLQAVCDKGHLLVVHTGRRVF